MDNIIQNDLIKKYGKGAFINGSQLQDYSNEMVSVSPKIDMILGGGIPGGSIVTLAGPSKCGKTVTALHILKNAQEKGRPVYFINVEGRIKPRDLKGIEGLNLDNLNIVRSYRDSDGQSKIFSAEEFLDIVEKIVHNIPHSVIIIDSISQLVTSGELEDDISKQSRAPGAMLMARFCRRLSNVVPVNDIILVGILHMIANTSGYGKTMVTSGGNKIKYALDIGLECKGFKLLYDGDTETGKPIGQDVEWITTSTAFAPPGQKTISNIIYGIGIDELREIIDIGIELGFIEKGGSWFTLSYMEEFVKDFPEDGKGYKIQGMNNLVNRLKDNDEEREKLIEIYRNLISYE